MGQYGLLEQTEQIKIKHDTVQVLIISGYALPSLKICITDILLCGPRVTLMWRTKEGLGKGKGGGVCSINIDRGRGGGRGLLFHKYWQDSYMKPANATTAHFLFSDQLVSLHEERDCRRKQYCGIDAKSRLTGGTQAISRLFLSTNWTLTW